MRRILLIIPTILAISIGLLSCQKSKERSALYRKPLKTVEKNFLSNIQKEYGLTCSGFGGTLQDKICLVFFALDSKERNCDQKTARELLVNCVDNYLLYINQNEKVRPYLSHYPFTNSGIKFRISFNRADRDAISFVNFSKDKVYYYSDGEDGTRFKLICEETYEEAKEKVMAGRSAAVGS